MNSPMKLKLNKHQFRIYRMMHYQSLATSDVHLKNRFPFFILIEKGII